MKITLQHLTSTLVRGSKVVLGVSHLHALPESAWVFSGYSSFLTVQKHAVSRVRLTGDFKLSRVVNVCKWLSASVLVL